MSERRDVIRMRENIEKAFFELSIEKPNRITVRDVIEKANISRGTFYAYFKDIPDLEQSMVQRVVRICHEKMSAGLTRGSIANVRSQIDFFLQILEEHSQAIRTFYTNGSTSIGIYNGLKQLIRHTLEEIFESDEHFSRENAYVLFSCAVGSAIDTCLNWIVDECPIPRETLVDEINRFIMGGAGSLHEGAKENASNK